MRSLIRACVAAVLLSTAAVAAQFVSVTSHSGIAIADAGAPAWWDGDCDENHWNAVAASLGWTGAGAHRLGASYLGVPACGPRPLADDAPDVTWAKGGWGESEWECTELAFRFMAQIYGVSAYDANGNTVVSNYSTSDGGNLVKINNGTVGKAPGPGDIISFNGGEFGHVDVVTASSVDGSGDGTVTTMNQNLDKADGWLTLTVHDWTVSSYGNLTPYGWLHDPAGRGNPGSPGRGFADFVTGEPDGHGGTSYFYYLSHGDGTFAKGTASGATNEPTPTAMATADINDDGNADLVAAEPAAGGQVSYFYYLSHGDGTFTKGTAVGATSEPKPVLMATGDINHDGKDDIVAAEPAAGGQVSYFYYLSHGDGTFTKGTAVGATHEPTPEALTAGDINGDGKVDLLAGEPDGAGGVSYFYYLSHGDGRFTKGTAIGATNEPAPITVASGDLNGDGDADLLAGDPDGHGGVSYFYYLSHSDGTFTKGTAVGATNEPKPLVMATGDVNGSGLSEIATSRSGLVVGVPHPPTGVSATAGDGKATVSWQAPNSDGGAPITDYTVTAAPGGATATVSGSPPVPSAIVQGLTDGVSYVFTVTATNGIGTSAPSAPSAPVTPVAPLKIKTGSVPDGTIGIRYHKALKAAGGTTPYQWSLMAGTLPTGITLTARGVLRGSPASSGSYTFTVEVVDSSSPGRTASKTLTLVVN